MVRTLIDFAPAELALAPRPLEGELTSSWLYRVAAANLVELEELLSALLDLYPEVHIRSNICLDYGIAPAWSRALAIWCRLAESRIHKLDLARVFPGRHLNWFVHGNGAFSSGRNSGGGSVWWMAFIFCPRCLDQQVKDGLPVHRRAEWTLAFLTHCPQHQDEPLRHYCLCCHREEPRWIITREGKDEEVQCRHCGTALSHWPRGTIDRFSPPLQVTLRLESTILRSLSGQAPDPFWVGNVDAGTFANLVSDLLLLLAEPDRQGVLALADHLGGEDWWDKHRLGYGVVTTVASLQHWASRLKMVASVAKCLLGERSLQFFRFRGPRCVGQRDLYPFAILFRELPVDRQEELIRRAMRWPDPLTDQIVRVLKR